MQARAVKETMDKLFSSWYGSGADAKVRKVSDVAARVSLDLEVGVRVYEPQREGDASSVPCPLLVFAHGGGWVYGSVDSHDGLCRHFCAAGECVVVSVEYRQPPEHVFPAALLDVYSVCCWAVQHAAEFGADPGRVGVGGDSAGGNLAAAACLLARSHSWPPLAFQVLFCAVLGFPDPPPQSHLEPTANTKFLSHEVMKALYQGYVQEPALLQHPLASPLKADTLAGLPPTLVLTAELDILRSESCEYASRLSLDGVAVRHVISAGAVHTAQLALGPNPGAPEVRECLAAIGQAIRSARASGPCPSAIGAGTGPDLWTHVQKVTRDLYVDLRDIDTPLGRDSPNLSQSRL